MSINTSFFSRLNKKGRRISCNFDTIYSSHHIALIIVFFLNWVYMVLQCLNLLVLLFLNDVANVSASFAAADVVETKPRLEDLQVIEDGRVHKVQ